MTDVLKFSGGRKAVASIAGFCSGYVLLIVSAFMMSIDFGFISEEFDLVLDKIGNVFMLAGVVAIIFSHKFLLNPFNIVRFGRWLIENWKSLITPPKK